MKEGKDQEKKVAFILGAGFSRCAKVPIQAEFSPLLTSSDFNSPIDREITLIIKTFFKDAFGWAEGREIPSLEDVFTFIDLSVGNGHYLGHNYSSGKLRALRRMLIYRIFQILDQKFQICPEILDLLRFYLKYDCSFIVMNWDIVLEKHLLEINPDISVNYVAPIVNWSGKKKQNPQDGLKICKTHGSSNWVYCENCKDLFFQLDRKISLHNKAGLEKFGFSLFQENSVAEDLTDKIDSLNEENCCHSCGNRLSPHIATFSYRKSFRTAAYPAIWNEAENLLAKANQWVFIGYSLPEADFELKHLIKSAELRKPAGQHPTIEAVLFQDEHAREKFKRFFGDQNVKVFDKGLEEYVQHLNS